MDKEKAPIEKINKKFRVKGRVEKKRIWINIKREHLINLCRYLKKLGFRHLSAISVTDLIKEGKYELTYFIWSYHNKIALIIKTAIERKKPVIPSVVEIWEESAQIHERELHELFGVEFEGNPNLSELFLENWEGPPPFKKDFNWREYVREKYYSKRHERKRVYKKEAGSEKIKGREVLFGPAHPGSGNFGVKLRVIGERVMSAKADPGYLHRGFEKLMEYRTPMQNAVLSDRICVFEPLAWNLVHAEAVDKLMGMDVPERARYIRVIMAELSRIQSHIIWYGGMSMAVGFDTGFKLAFGYRDYILDIFELITGGRVYPTGYICPGGVRNDMPVRAKERILKVLDKMNEIKLLEKFENPTLLSRLKDTGALKLENAIRLGATGPVLRASGMKTDARKDDPYEMYNQFDFTVPVRKEGDAYSRYLVGIREIEESIKIIRQALDKLPYRPLKPIKPKFSVQIPEGEVYVRNEIARGEAALYMVSDGTEKPYRCKIRGPSFLHMIPVLEYLLKGVQIADVPVIYWSLNPCPADMDR